MNNLVFVTKQNTNNVLKISLLLLLLFITLTIVVYNIYKGTKIILPNLEDELKESSHFHLLKSLGWSFLVTILFAFFLLSGDKKTNNRYAVNKAVRI